MTVRTGTQELVPRDMPTVPYRKRVKRLFGDAVFRYQCFRSRQQAHRVRERIVARQGFSRVDSRVRREIRNYSRAAFGSTSFWPWLAAYTEVHGSFVRGWIPDELLVYRLFPRANPIDIAHVSLHKTLDYRLFGDMCIRPVLIFAGGCIHDADYTRIGIDQAREVLKRHDGEVVIKRDGGSGGDDIFFVHALELDPQRYLNEGNWVVQPAVRQHDDLAKPYPHSVNTIRFLTTLDSRSNIRVLFALLRLGANGARVDNIAKGGRFLYLNADGRALTHAIDDLGIEFEDCHPDSGYAYRAITVPQFAQARSLCIEAHRRFPYAAIVGWDVVIDAGGRPRLLEWNARLPHSWMNEPHRGPLWDVDDPRLRPSPPGHPHGTGG
ncbi:sugar-transfer associated ATP-grasp domain-containing protein [Thioalkalivibrio paradoxus]|uniref:sugar-transfer associated ATP-grasp domain-containing protein n=1 Tax=Thioalkalivibrio paradoxus TaxID=108010 RepID=UPI0003048454|nr:sugar-transfer associated ATP-grasp domain-containing protein [Thioalkalivibrio paradoxus]